MAIKYADVKAGDTLLVVGNHTLNGRTSPFKDEEPVQVETVGEHFVDVRKKGEKETHRFAFEHGREKLEYTKETAARIKNRNAFDGEETGGAEEDDEKIVLLPEPEELKGKSDAELRGVVEKLNGARKAGGLSQIPLSPEAAREEIVQVILRNTDEGRKQPGFFSKLFSRNA